MPEHVDIVDPEIHEPKGVASATSGQVYVADGAGSGAWTTGADSLIKTATAGQIVVANGAGLATAQIGARMGWQDWNDATTSGTPITLSTAGTFFVMTNDGAGAATSTAYKIPDHGNIWNTSTNRFDFTSLAIGDSVDIRWDMTFTTTGANHEIVIEIQLAEGTGGVYQLPFARHNYKAAGTYRETGSIWVYMGDTNTKDNPASIQVSSDTGTTDTVTVAGWATRTIARSDY